MCFESQNLGLSVAWPLSNNCFLVTSKVAAAEAGLIGDDAAPRLADEGGANLVLVAPGPDAAHHF